MYLMKARIVEVNIGYIENKSKPWEGLGQMSKEVSRAIISKALGVQKMNYLQLKISLQLKQFNAKCNTIKENLSDY